MDKSLENSSAANSRQVGGGHYSQGAATQHWDYAAANKLGYFEGQISKYVTRWKVKHPTVEGKLIDLGKAEHFAAKLLELARQGRACPVQTHEAEVSVEDSVYRVNVVDYCMAHNLTLREVGVLGALQAWADTGNMKELAKCHSFIQELVACAPDLLAEGAEPTSGYVNQG
jgi:hypothetical protein